MEVVPSMTVIDAWNMPLDYAIDLSAARRALSEYSLPAAGAAPRVERATTRDGRKMPPGLSKLRRMLGGGR